MIVSSAVEMTVKTKLSVTGGENPTLRVAIDEVCICFFVLLISLFSVGNAHLYVYFCGALEISHVLF